MELNPRGRRGVASVIGTMLFVIVLMAAIGVQAYISGLQTQSSQAAQQAQQLLNQKGKESLTFQALSGGTLAVANTGSSGSTIKYMILKFANGSVYQFAPNQSVGSGSLLSVPSLIPSQNCGSSTCLSKYAAILNSTKVGDSVGVVTSLGNVFWEKPALAVQASTPGTTVQMTFTASGDSAFASSPVLLVDGTSYTQAQLPATVTWFVGTKHSYAWQSLPQGTGTRVGATVTGSAQSQSGTITATSTGSIAATFTTQYLLTITGGSGVTVNPSSPTGDGYYPAGTGVQITAPNVWNMVAGQSRSNLVSYSLDGGSPTSVTRSGSGNFVYSLTMNNPHTIAFNSVTQYYVTASNNVPASGSLPALTVNYGYTGTQTIPQAAQTPSLSSWSPWEKHGKLMGIPLPTIDVQMPRLELKYSFMNTGSACDATTVEFFELLKLLARMAEIRTMAWRLAKEVRKTQRRVNALEKIVIPDVDDTRKFIEGVLEEREREVFFVQKILKVRLFGDRV